MQYSRDTKYLKLIGMRLHITGCLIFGSNLMKLKEIVPPILVSMYRCIGSWIRYVLYRSALRKNKILLNSKNNRVVYVLGNGPSLNGHDLEKLIGEDVISMNYFHLHPCSSKLNIVAHCVGEPYTCATWIDPGEMIRNVKAETYWFNLTAKKFCKKNYANKDIYYYFPGSLVGCNLLPCADLSLPALPYQSTSQMAIMVAIYMGYKKIYLIGFDHDWLATSNGYSPHFYSEDGERGDVKKADFSIFSYLDMINISKTLFEIYGAIKVIALKKGVRIINLSRPTYLDIFPFEDK